MLGDVVVTTALIKPLKDALPDAKIYYLVQNPFITLLDGHPDIEGCIVDPLPYSMKPEHKPAFKALAKELRQEGFDVFIGLWEKPRYGRLAKQAKIPIRIGHRSSLDNIWNYTHTVPQDYLDYTRHKVDSNMALLGPLGVKQTDSAPVDLRMADEPLSDLKRRFPWMSDPYVMVHIDAGTPQRVLPTAHFISIVNYLRQLNVPKIVLFGREGSAERAADILNAVDHDSSVIAITNSADLSDIKGLISQCRFLIGSDSGPVHIATGFQKPVIVYYFNRIQNAMNWGPWMSPHTIIKSKHNCIDACKPDVCRKPDCRTDISIPAFKEAIDLYWHHRAEARPNQRHYWLEKTVYAAVFGPGNHDIAKALTDQGYTALALDLSLPYKTLIEQLNALNANVFIVAAETIPFMTKLKCTILQRWLSNRIHFFPKIVAAATPFEALHRIAEMGEV
jgi:heptosyltransferase-2